VFKKLHELGIHVIVLHPEKADWIMSYVDEWILGDVYDHNASLNAVKEYINAGKTVDGIITFWEESVPLTAKIVDLLGTV
jgi:hypothetical protein